MFPEDISMVNSSQFELCDFIVECQCDELFDEAFLHEQEECFNELCND